jgi:excinuclease ABC subunit A
MAISLITRLHFDDMRKFLAILLKLVNAGNSCQADSPPQQPLSLVVREAYSFRIPALHEERFTFHASEGGQIMAEGRPEQVAKVANSYTGKFLAPLLADEKTARQRL